MAPSSQDPLPVPRSASTERAESYGPVTLTRHVKDDGRALILYTREQAPKDVSAPREEPREEKARRA